MNVQRNEKGVDSRIICTRRIVEFSLLFLNFSDEQSAENSSRRKRSGGRSSVNQQDSSTENGGGASQTETPSSKALKREPSETNSTSKSNSKNSAVSSAPQNAPIDIVLRLKTEETSNSKSNDNENSNDESLSKTEDAAMCKYLKTSRDASIEHIVAYLKLRIEELKPFLVNSNQRLPIISSPLSFTDQFIHSVY